MRYPCQLSSSIATDDSLAALSSIPGVSVGRMQTGEARVSCTEDVLSAVQAIEPSLVVVKHTPPVLRQLLPHPPSGYSRLYPFQKEDVRLLATGQRDGLWNTMGTGKTSTALVAARAVQARRVLVITRAIGRDSWVRDNAWASQYNPVRVLVGELGASGPTTSAIAAARRMTRRLQQAYGGGVVATAELTDDAELVIAGWETLASGRPAFLRRDLQRPWDLLIMDEHHYAKSRRAARTVAAEQVQAQIRWGLTGTAEPDRPRDLWTQLHHLNPQAWGRTPSRFFKRYCHAVPGQYGGLDTTGPHVAVEDACAFCQQTTRELRGRLMQRFTMRTRSSVADQLPAKTTVTVRVPRDASASAERDMVTALDDRKGLEGALAHAHTAKRPTIVELAVEALTGRGKVVVTTSRLRSVPVLRSAILAAIKTPAIRSRVQAWELTGAVEASMRTACARDYMASEGPALIVATHQSIAESMDLQDTDAAIISDIPLTPRELLQLEGRFVRIGQRRPVTIYYVVAEGTVDEQHLALVLSKLAAVEQTAGLPDAIEVGGGAADEAEILSRLNAWLEEEARHV